jgi:hypothetical protein
MSSEIETTVNFDAQDAPTSLELRAFSEPETDLSDSQTAEAEDLTESGSLSGYELVADMMRRQDDAINQLDDLNARIESAIAEISASRNSQTDDLELGDGYAGENVHRAA